MLDPLLAGMAGFEPTSHGVKVRCLTPWRHPLIKFKEAAFSRLFGFGVDNRIRTDGLKCHKLAR